MLSIAAGVTIAELEAAAPGPPGRPGDAEHAGARPPRRVGDRGRDATPTEADLEQAERLLGAVGIVVRVPEKMLDAVTGLSGSGPAYVFLLAEALIEAGVLNGLPRDIATTLVRPDDPRRGALLVDSDEGPEALRAAVTSPGGTTAAGLRALEQGSMRGAILDAVTAATERSRELGRVPMRSRMSRARRVDGRRGSSRPRCAGCRREPRRAEPAVARREGARRRPPRPARALRAALGDATGRRR